MFFIFRESTQGPTHLMLNIWLLTEYNFPRNRADVSQQHLLDREMDQVQKQWTFNLIWQFLFEQQPYFTSSSGSMEED